MMLIASWDERGADFAMGLGATVRLSAADLYEGADERFDSGSGQRLTPVQATPHDLALSSFEAVEGGWRIGFGAHGAGLVRFARLEPYLAPRLGRPAALGWRQAPEASLQTFDYADFLASDETLRAALGNFARYGWFRIVGAPVAPGTLETATARFGRIRETNYGRLFDVVVKPGAENLAYTDLGLEPHTDNPYRQPVPGVQLLHCLQASAEGGENRLVDGLGACEALRAADPQAFALLRQVAARFAWSDGATYLAASAPVIETDGAGRFQALRYNHRSFCAIEADLEGRAAWRAAYAQLAALINDPAAGLDLKLAAGDVLVMDNRRVLHGRLAFKTEAAAARRLQGAYADHDALYSTLERLNRAEAERRVAEVEALFLSEVMDQGYGEAISIRDHMLQGGELAARRGLGLELIAAALLHDIGWGMDDQTGHETSAADLLEPIFGAGVSEPVRQHVAAKRYLVAREAGYGDRLSQASVDTLARQGGPFTAAEAEAFAQRADFAANLAHRRIDDDAKVVGAAAAPFSQFRDLLLHLALRRLEA